MNSLSYCSQAVLAAAEDMKKRRWARPPQKKLSESQRIEASQIAAFLAETPES